MNALEVFTSHAGSSMRVAIDENGEPWFVIADIAGALDLSNPSAAAGSLELDDLSTAEVIDSMGRTQTARTTNEAGLYQLVFQSRKPEAKSFKRWVTHEVLPSIRRTGAYVVPETPEQLMARAVLNAQEIIARKDEQIAVLAPRAEAWDELASADGDYSVADAAKILARAGIETGPQRLFDQLADAGWIFRGRDGKWRAYAELVSRGHLTEKPQSHYHPRTSELVLDAPQVRVTLGGIERLRIHLGKLTLAAV